MCDVENDEDDDDERAKNGNSLALDFRSAADSVSQCKVNPGWFPSDSKFRGKSWALFSFLRMMGTSNYHMYLLLL